MRHRSQFALFAFVACLAISACKKNNNVDESGARLVNGLGDTLTNTEAPPKQELNSQVNPIGFNGEAPEQTAPAKDKPETTTVPEKKTQTPVKKAPAVPPPTPSTVRNIEEAVDAYKFVLKNVDESSGTINFDALYASKTVLENILSWIGSNKNKVGIQDSDKNYATFLINAYNIGILGSIVNKMEKNGGKLPETLYPTFDAIQTFKVQQGMIIGLINKNEATTFERIAMRIHEKLRSPLKFLSTYILIDGTVGGPRLLNEPIDAEQLEDRLMNRKKFFLKNVANVKIEGSKLLVSKLIYQPLKTFYRNRGKDFAAYFSGGIPEMKSEIEKIKPSDIQEMSGYDLHPMSQSD